jgi:DNA-binding winged helix-turn-helix (wHTH) protein/tetratricopeptide (TPR) repeat protein
VIYRFDDCVLDTQRRELCRDGALRRLEPQVFDVLEYLVRHRERVVSKDDLLQAVWRGRAVADTALSTRINAARVAIGDSGAEQRLIRTLYGRGFRFVGQVRDQGGPVLGISTSPQTRSFMAARPVIAVAPFVEVGGGRRYFAEALTHALVTGLSQLDWLAVASRGEALAAAHDGAAAGELARRLGIRYVLRGAVSGTGDRLRVTVKLVDEVWQCNLWAERYDRNCEATFAVEDELTKAIVAKIAPQIFRAEHVKAERAAPENLSAWQYIVRALSLMNKRTKPHIATARELVRKAIAVDPSSAKARSLLSFMTTMCVHQGWAQRRTASTTGLALARTALSLDPDEPWAHLAYGYAMIWRNSEDALPPLERMLDLDPKLAVGHYIHALASARSGWSQGVLERAELAATLSDFDLLARGNSGVYDNVRASSSFVAGRYRDGIAFATRSIAANPRLGPAYRQLVACSALAGDLERARKALRSLRRITPEISIKWIEEDWNWSRPIDQKNYVEAFRIAGLA